MAEILASQRRMLERRGEDTEAVDDAEMARLFEKHLAQVYDWMDQQSNLTYLDVDYNATVVNPRVTVDQIEAFLGLRLNLQAMVAVVDSDLYRQHA
jgi:hypothetical protein